MRHYHIDIARYAADAERKWIDNLLSHFDIDGVERVQRGSARRISTIGIYRIALVRKLVVELDTTVKSAVELSRALLHSEAPKAPVGGGLSLLFDRHAFETAVDARIAEAVESIVPTRRGRPPIAPTHGAISTSVRQTKANGTP